MNFIASFDNNLKSIQTALERDDTLRVKRVRNPNFPTVKIAVLASAAMVSNDVADRDVIRPLTTQNYEPTPEGALAGGINNHSVEICKDLQKALDQLCFGDCIVLIGDADRCLIIDAKGIASRSVQVPESEGSLMGPQDGFNENIMANLGILKKRLANSSLKSEFINVGRRANNKLAICYLDGVVHPSLVAELKKRLQKIDIDGLLDGNVLAELVQERKFSIFKTVGTTGRPDVLVSRLLEGRIGVILDGSPVVITVPYIFAESIQSPDDYYQNYIYANIGRFLRVIGFLIAVFFPGVYLALVCHHPEALPAHWLYTVLSASLGVPIQAITEILILFLAFEILRETGSRMPSGLGLALNVVGAVILGDAAVNSKIVSVPMVIIVAFSGATGLMVRDLKGPVFYFRLAGILLAFFWGLPGVAVVGVYLLMNLASLESLGVPYLYTMDKKQGNQDTLLRMPYWKMIRRQPRFAQDERRQK